MQRGQMAWIPQGCFAHCGVIRHLHVQALHIRGFSGMGLSFLNLLAACYSLFSIETRSLTVALAMMPDVRVQRAYHAQGWQLPARKR